MWATAYDEGWRDGHSGRQCRDVDFEADFGLSISLAYLEGFRAGRAARERGE
jgi:hypothetical protein